MTLTYRPNKTDTLHAAYCNAVRIGYVEQRLQFGNAGAVFRGRWRYQLSLVQSGGGHAFGVVDTEQAAKDELETAFAKWLLDAGLKHG